MKTTKQERGFSIIEILTVISILAGLFLITSLNYRDLNSAAQSGSRELFSYLKTVQGKAMATTSTITVFPQTSRRLTAQSATSCSSAQRVEDRRLALELPPGASLSSTNWSICFNSRGLADNSVDIMIADERVTKALHVGLGGGIKLE